MTVNNRQSPVAVDRPAGPLYHASNAQMAPGDDLLPGRRIGKGRGQFVWFTTGPEQFWAPDGHMYEVEPIGPIETCRGAFRARSARIIREVTNEEVAHAR